MFLPTLLLWFSYCQSKYFRNIRVSVSLVRVIDILNLLFMICNKYRLAETFQLTV